MFKIFQLLILNTADEVHTLNWRLLFHTDAHQRLVHQVCFIKWWLGWEFILYKL